MILAIVQARLSSTRLPGKVLKPILGRPMLELQLERLKRARTIDHLVVATSDHASDDPLADLCRTITVDCFRGDLDDVLDRFYRAARQFRAEHIIRLTGDCPLADPTLIDAVVDYYRSSELDYASNTIEPSFPDGLDVEVFSTRALAEAWKEARLPSQREHVTPFIWRQPERFNVANYTAKEDLSSMRWTVDEPEDFELVRGIYEALYPDNPCFDTADISRFLLDHPELAASNAQFVRNEGYLRSMAEDQEGGNA